MVALSVGGVWARGCTCHGGLPGCHRCGVCPSLCQNAFMSLLFESCSMVHRCGLQSRTGGESSYNRLQTVMVRPFRCHCHFGSLHHAYRARYACLFSHCVSCVACISLVVLLLISLFVLLLRFPLSRPPILTLLLTLHFSVHIPPPPNCLPCHPLSSSARSPPAFSSPHLPPPVLVAGLCMLTCIGRRRGALLRKCVQFSSSCSVCPTSPALKGLRQFSSPAFSSRKNYVSAVSGHRVPGRNHRWLFAYHVMVAAALWQDN